MEQTIKLELTTAEAQVFREILSAAMKVVDVDGADYISHFNRKLKAAIEEANKPKPAAEEEPQPVDTQ